MGCLNLHFFFFLPSPRAPSMVLRLVSPNVHQDDKCLWPCLQQGNGAVFMQKFSEWAKQILRLFLLANVAAAEVWLGPGSPDAEVWVLFRVTGQRGPLASVWRQEKKKKEGMKMRPQLHYFNLCLTSSSAVLQRWLSVPCLSRHCHQRADLFIFILQIQITLLLPNCSGIKWLIRLCQPMCTSATALCLTPWNLSKSKMTGETLCKSPSSKGEMAQMALLLQVTK